MNKIILLEPNPYHSEVLPGIVKYFEDLDYVVDVYIRKEVIGQNVFCRYQIKGKIVSYVLDEVRNILASNQMQEYDFLFLSSMEHSENGKLSRFLDEIGIVPQTKYGVLGLYHTNFLISQFSDYQMQNQERLFFISSFQTKEYDHVNALSPIYFGKNQVRYRKNTKKITLLVVGSGMDILMFQEAYWSLSLNEREKLKIRCIGQNQAHSLKDCLYNFSMAVKGIFVPRFRKCKDIVKLEKVRFDQMYLEVEQADFILVLLDPEQEKHKHYIHSSTSGIRQLIFGFAKIGIIHEKIAKEYGFGGEICIGFSKGNLCQALKRAIYMQQEEYTHMVHLMRNERNSLFKKDEKELKMRLKRVKEMKKV